MDPDQPLVSVVLIFLNAERYLLEAIDSVRAQDYTNWELILVDDGSSDGSRTIAEAAGASAAGKIHYVQHAGGKNLGMGNSRNLGMSHASGVYITFLDADDFFLPSKLRVQVKLLQTHPNVAATSGRYLLLFSDEREYDINHRLQDLSDLADRTLQGRELIWRMNADESLTPQHGAMLIRLEAARAIGGFTDQFQGIYEDSVFFTKLLAAGTVYLSNDCVTVYRMHWDSFCHRAMERGEYPDTPLKSLRYQYNLWLLSFLRAQHGHSMLIALIRIEILSYRIRALYPVLKRLHRRIALYGRRYPRPETAEAGQSSDLTAAIAEVMRFYRSTNRIGELEQLVERMKRFTSAHELAGTSA